MKEETTMDDVQKLIDDEADKYGFVVPYDGSNKFYNDDKVNGFLAGAKFGQQITSAPLLKRIEELEAENSSLKELIYSVRPKAEAYDRACDHAGVENNLIGKFNEYKSRISELEKACEESLLLYNNQTATIISLEKERDELKSLVSDMGKHTNEVVCKHNILVEEIESLKKENERLKRLVPDHPKANP